MGFLATRMVDGYTGKSLTYEHLSDTSSVLIISNVESLGGITVVNLKFTLHDKPIYFWMKQYDRSKNPLYATYEEKEYEVLDEKELLTEEFKALL